MKIEACSTFLKRVESIMERYDLVLAACDDCSKQLDGLMKECEKSIADSGVTSSSQILAIQTEADCIMIRSRALQAARQDLSREFHTAFGKFLNDVVAWLCSSPGISSSLAAGKSCTRARFGCGSPGISSSIAARAAFGSLN